MYTGNVVKRTCPSQKKGATILNVVSLELANILQEVSKHGPLDVCTNVTWHVLGRDLAVPKRVEALQGVNVVLMSGGWRHAVAADDQGRMYGWGWNKACTSSLSRVPSSSSDPFSYFSSPSFSSSCSFPPSSPPFVLILLSF